MRAIVVSLLALVMLFVAAGPVLAQNAPPPPREPPRSATVLGKQVSSRDVRVGPNQQALAGGGKRSVSLAIAFWAFAALAVAGSLFVITRKNLITAVMGMVGTFFSIAALYMMLYAHFLAIIQLLVYAGAIMVLFVFVIMILNKPEDEPYGTAGRVGKVVAGLAMAYLLFRLGTVLVGVDHTVTAAQLDAPAPTAQGYDYGSTAAVGWNLFTDYLFPFEAVSVLLLIAVVGSIAIARPLKDDEVEAAPAGSAEGGG